MRQLLQNEKDFFVPKVYEDVSTKRVLTTDLIFGIPIDQLKDWDQEVICFFCSDFNVTDQRLGFIPSYEINS